MALAGHLCSVLPHRRSRCYGFYFYPSYILFLFLFSAWPMTWCNEIAIFSYCCISSRIDSIKSMSGPNTNLFQLWETSYRCLQGMI